MKKNIYEIASLFKKSLVEDLNGNEIQNLEQLLEDKELKKIYEQLNEPHYLQEKLSEYSDFSGTEAYQRFLDNIGSSKRTKNRKKLIYIFSAAAVLLILILSITFLNTEKESNLTNTEDTTIKEVEIQAGEKKALLILADGSTVNVGKDNITLHGEDGVNIKYSNGEVSYELANKPTELVHNQLIVPRGGETFITLEDGTKVWINADSKLKYPIAFIGNERKVFLEGEAYFEVAENKNKKFIVNTTYGDINVLGTSFGVNAYLSENVCYATLVKGKINFKTKDRSPIDMRPGEQVVASGDGTLFKRQVKIEEYVGWKDGIYSFRQKALKDIMKTFELWYNVSVEYEDPSIKTILFTGHIKRYDNINIFLSALSRTGDVRYKAENNKIILYK
ncbi:MAG: FecR family protein [Dysgonomonas sp.]|nr:FecR family protein [Dysgonomonas sp.]